MKMNSNIQPVITGCRLAVVAALIAGLAGCASSADPKAMVVAAPAATAKPFPAALQHAMCVRNVTGGEKTNPMWASKVDNEGFKAALSSSMDASGLNAASGCTFPVDANLLGLSQPSFGFDITVTAHVNYKVYLPSGEPLLLATIDSPYLAKMSEAFVGVERLKKANEGSIRTSISMFLDKLRDATPVTVVAPAAPAAPAAPVAPVAPATPAATPATK
jgi:hypothetical protein